MFRSPNNQPAASQQVNTQQPQQNVYGNQQPLGARAYQQPQQPSVTGNPTEDFKKLFEVNTPTSFVQQRMSGQQTPNNAFQTAQNNQGVQLPQGQATDPQGQPQTQPQQSLGDNTPEGLMAQMTQKEQEIKALQDKVSNISSYGSGQDAQQQLYKDRADLEAKRFDYSATQNKLTFALSQRQQQPQQLMQQGVARTEASELLGAITQQQQLAMQQGNSLIPPQVTQIAAQRYAQKIINLEDTGYFQKNPELRDQRARQDLYYGLYQAELGQAASEAMMGVSMQPQQQQQGFGYAPNAYTPVSGQPVMNQQPVIPQNQIGAVRPNTFGATLMDDFAQTAAVDTSRMSVGEIRRQQQAQAQVNQQSQMLQQNAQQMANAQIPVQSGLAQQQNKALDYNSYLAQAQQRVATKHGLGSQQPAGVIGFQPFGNRG